jgi:hypothetical protein
LFVITKTPDLIYSDSSPSHPPPSWIAGIIIHDSYHPEQFKQKLPFGDVEGAEREREANAFTVKVGEKIGLPQGDLNVFRKGMVDPGTRYQEPFKAIPKETTRPPSRKWVDPIP